MLRGERVLVMPVLPVERSPRDCGDERVANGPAIRNIETGDVKQGPSFARHAIDDA